MCVQFCLCIPVDLRECVCDYYVCVCACNSECMCVWEQERVVGSARSSVCQRSQSPGSLIPLPCGSENFLSSFPVLSPRWAKRATPGKFMLMSAMKTPLPFYHVSKYLSNSSLSILSLSPSFSSFSLNISILTDVRFWNLKSMLARGFTLHMACCLCGDFGNTALYWSPQGLGQFGGVF